MISDLPLSGLEVAIVGSTPVGAASAGLYNLLGASTTVFTETSPGADTVKGQEEDLVRLLTSGSNTVQTEDNFDPDSFERIAGCDVIIADLSHDRRVTSDDFVDGYIEKVRRGNRSVWVTVSGFGIESRWRTFRSSEITALASGGIPFYMRDGDTRPVKPAGYTASIAAGHVAALAGLYGRTSREGREPIHFDLSMQDSVVTTGVFLECAHALFKSPGKGGMGRYAAPRGYFECRDGYVFVVVLEDHQWAGFLAALQNPEWARDIKTNADRLESASLIEQEIRNWAKTLAASDCADLLQRHGVPASSLNSCGDLLGEEDFLDDGFLGSTGNDSEMVPGIPAKLSRQDPSPRATETGRPVRILDVGNVLAGPLATSWLGTMGLDVLKLEDPTRLDIYRRRGPFIEGGDDIEHGAYFAAANYSKRSCSFEFETPEGKRRLRQLMGESDFVIENLSSSRASRLGLSVQTADELGATLVSSSGFGRNGRKSDYRAYGQIIHSYGGITYETRDAAGDFRALGTSWADPLTSVWICVLVLAQLLQPDRSRLHIDLSMVKVVARQLPEYFAAASRGETVEMERANRLAGYAPHGIYRADGDDQWLALAVGADWEWDELVEVLGDPRLQQPEFATFEQRFAHKRELDELLDELIGGFQPSELFERLQAVGVTCSPVWGARALAKSTHLRERGLIQMVQHPVWGEREVTGLPWRIVGGGPLVVRPTPTLGNADGYE